MEGKRFFLLTLVLILLGLWVTGTAAVSAVSNNASGPVADVITAPTGITLVPNVNYQRLVVKVSTPDGTIFVKTFEPGVTPLLNLADLKEHCGDGSYTYELRVIALDAGNIGEDLLSEGISPPPGRAPVQTGYFTINSGAIVTAAPPEEISRTQDVVHLDDVIINGSLCIGFDCYDGYSFHFDTLVLMENSLRIFFNDTSSTLAFPSNDWRIICNDSDNGGASYFAIEDATGATIPFTIEAGAPANSIYVDDNGRIGIGTSAPAKALEIERTGINAVMLLQRTGGAKSFINAGNNKGNVGTKTNHPFRIVVDNDWTARFNTDGSLDMASGAVCTMAGQWLDASSIRYKENIHNLTGDEALAALKGLTPVKYNYKVDQTEKNVGFIAEEVPELVSTKDKKGLNALEITAVLTKVVQEQQATISELKKKIAELEKKVK